MKYGCN